MIVLPEIYEHVIHSFLREQGGSASKKEIYKALGDDAASKEMIDERLRTMERFGIITIEGEAVKIR